MIPGKKFIHLCVIFDRISKKTCRISKKSLKTHFDMRKNSNIFVSEIIKDIHTLSVRRVYTYNN